MTEKKFFLNNFIFIVIQIIRFSQICFPYQNLWAHVHCLHGDSLLPTLASNSTKNPRVDSSWTLNGEYWRRRMGNFPKSVSLNDNVFVWRLNSGLIAKRENDTGPHPSSKTLIAKYISEFTFFFKVTLCRYHMRLQRNVLLFTFNGISNKYQSPLINSDQILWPNKFGLGQMLLPKRLWQNF